MDETGSILAFTLGVALASTVLILPFGVAAAFALSRARGVARTIVETLFSLPLVLPPTAVGLLLLEVLSPQTTIGRVLAAAGLRVLFTWKGVVLATAVMSFPLLVRSARTAFEEIDPRLLAVARTLGCGRLEVFRRVTLPLAARGIAAGTILAFSRAIGEFGATVIVAGYAPQGRQTLALAIFHRATVRDDAAAMRLVGVAVLFAFVAIGATEIVAGRRARRLEG
jgi:molybdate transport system permease protein